MASQQRVRAKKVDEEVPEAVEVRAPERTSVLDDELVARIDELLDEVNAAEEKAKFQAWATNQRFDLLYRGPGAGSLEELWQSIEAVRIRFGGGENGLCELCGLPKAGPGRFPCR